MVGLAVGGIVAALGVGTIYLPFIADKDRVRGLHEEGDLTPSEKREYEQMLKAMGRELPEHQQTPAAKKSIPTKNSMWKRMDDASKT
jgi:hypothetical protein